MEWGQYTANRTLSRDGIRTCDTWNGANGCDSSTGQIQENRNEKNLKITNKRVTSLKHSLNILIYV